MPEEPIVVAPEKEQGLDLSKVADILNAQHNPLLVSPEPQMFKPEPFFKEAEATDEVTV